MPKCKYTPYVKNYMKEYMKEYRRKHPDRDKASREVDRIRNNLNYEAKAFMKRVDPFLFNY